MFWGREAGKSHRTSAAAASPRPPEPAGGRGRHPSPGLRPKGRPRSPREPAWQVGRPGASGGAGGGGRSRAPRDASPTRPDSHDRGCSVRSLRARSLMSAGGESQDLPASASPERRFRGRPTAASTAQSARAVSPPLPLPHGAVLAAPERWGRYKGVEVTQKGRKRDGTGAAAPERPSQAPSRGPHASRDPEPPLPSWLAAERLDRLPATPAARSCSHRRRRPWLCRLARPLCDRGAART